MLLHARLGDVARGELHVGRETESRELLDAVLYRRRVVAQHAKTRPVGNDLDLHALPLRLVHIQDIRNVVQRLVHDRRIVLVDLNCDVVLLLDIYPAGETPIEGVTTPALVQKIKSFGHGNALYAPNNEMIESYIAENAKDGDAVIVMGAGSVTKLSDLLAERFAK